MVEKKNIHLLPTFKPSRLHRTGDFILLDSKAMPYGTLETINQHIYITSDEEIKEGDYWIYICPINGLDYGDNNNPIVKNNLPPTWFEKLHDRKNYKKIILTTDQDLIKDGVQAIDNEFLEWFVKNPSCEEVEIRKEMYMPQSNGKISDGKITHEISLNPLDNTLPYYKIIIPKEPKQETLEEAALKLYQYQSENPPYTIITPKAKVEGFIEGAKWMKEDMIEELEMHILVNEHDWNRNPQAQFRDFVEQFKKK